MNHVLQAVLDYVQTPQTDYALLITGQWGCGKTYFWKNVIAPDLSHAKCGAQPCRPLYASLYGVGSVKDIDTQLFLESYPGLRNQWVSRLASASRGIVGQLWERFLKFEPPRMDLRWLLRTKGALICFDDLERTKLSMREALGYINGFVEHERVKTIILCNEDGITEEAEKATYHAMKEKVVGASLAFRADLDTVFRTLTDEHKARPAFHGFLVRNAELLRTLFDRSQTGNIRAARRAITSLLTVFDVLAEGPINPNTVARPLLSAVAPAVFELCGRHADPDRLKKILSMKDMLVVRMSLADRQGEKSDEERYEAEFAERYLSHLGLAELQQATGCPAIYEFLLTGFLDRAALLDWAKELVRPPDERAERITRLSLDAEGMEDDDFARTAAQVMDEVKAGEIAAAGGNYVILYGTFERFADRGLIPMTRQEILESFIGGLRKAEDAGKLQPNVFLKDDIDHPAVAPRTEEGRALRQSVLEANERVLVRRARERVRSAVSRRNEDAQGFIDALMGEGGAGLLFTPVFQELDADDTAAWILALPNSLKMRFGRAVLGRYEKHSRLAEFPVELPILGRIRDVLKARCESSPGGRTPIRVSLSVVKAIVEALDRVIDQLKQVEQQNRARVPESAEGQPQKEQSGNADDSAGTNDAT